MSGNSGMSLADELVDLRVRLAATGGPFAEFAEAAFDNSPPVVWGWLTTAAAQCASRDFVLVDPDDPQAETLYLEMGDFVVNTDRWEVAALAFGPVPPHGAEPSVSDFFDGVVGVEVGDVRLPALPLTGMEGMQARFGELGSRAAVPGREVAEAYVRVSMFDLVDRALRCGTGTGLGMRLAAARHEDEQICVWEVGEAHDARPIVHRPVDG